MGGGSEKANAGMKASAAANSTLQQAVQREYRQYVNLLPIADNDPSMHATPPSGCSALHQALEMRVRDMEIPKLIGKIHEMPRQNQFSAPLRKRQNYLGKSSPVLPVCGERKHKVWAAVSPPQVHSDSNSFQMHPAF